MTKSTKSDSVLSLARSRWKQFVSFGWSDNTTRAAVRMKKRRVSIAHRDSFRFAERPLDALTCKDYFEKKLATEVDEAVQESLRNRIEVVNVLEKLTTMLRLPFVRCVHEPSVIN